MTQTPGSHPPGPPEPPYEPHPNNLIRDRKKLRDQYGPYSYTMGMSVNGARTPMKPRNIRIRSSIPILFAVAMAIAATWFLLHGYGTGEVLLCYGFAAFFLFLTWIGFRTARIREQWERENPDLAKNIDY